MAKAAGGTHDGCLMARRSSVRESGQGMGAMAGGMRDPTAVEPGPRARDSPAAASGTRAACSCPCRRAGRARRSPPPARPAPSCLAARPLGAQPWCRPSQPREHGSVGRPAPARSWAAAPASSETTRAASSLESCLTSGRGRNCRRHLPAHQPPLQLHQHSSRCIRRVVRSSPRLRLLPRQRPRAGLGHRRRLVLCQHRCTLCLCVSAAATAALLLAGRARSLLAALAAAADRSGRRTLAPRRLRRFGRLGLAALARNLLETPAVAANSSQLLWRQRLGCGRFLVRGGSTRGLRRLSLRRLPLCRLPLCRFPLLRLPLRRRRRRLGSLHGLLQLRGRLSRSARRLRLHPCGRLCLRLPLHLRRRLRSPCLCRRQLLRGRPRAVYNSRTGFRCLPQDGLAVPLLDHRRPVRLVNLGQRQGGVVAVSGEGGRVRHRLGRPDAAHATQPSGERLHAHGRQRGRSSLLVALPALFPTHASIREHFSAGEIGLCLAVEVDAEARIVLLSFRGVLGLALLLIPGQPRGALGLGGRRLANVHQPCLVFWDQPHQRRLDLVRVSTQPPGRAGLPPRNRKLALTLGLICRTLSRAPQLVLLLQHRVEPGLSQLLEVEHAQLVGQLLLLLLLARLVRQRLRVSSAPFGSRSVDGIDGGSRRCSPDILEIVLRLTANFGRRLLGEGGGPLLGLEKPALRLGLCRLRGDLLQQRRPLLLPVILLLKLHRHPEAGRKRRLGQVEARPVERVVERGVHAQLRQTTLDVLIFEAETRHLAVELMQFAHITEKPAAAAVPRLLLRLRLVRAAQNVAQLLLLLGLQPDGVRRGNLRRRANLGLLLVHPPHVSQSAARDAHYFLRGLVDLSLACV
eukprot:scaffold16045_cov110-Isochrysis_galbana.AAC.8